MGVDVISNTVTRQCPSCSSTNIYRSHAKSVRDKIVKSILQAAFYRCHDCNHRWARGKGGAKSLAMAGLSLAGYFGGVLLILGLAIAAIVLALALMGVPLPW
jgi:predicted RNA-binding Zn-ribbon protein involved in translation (DUF1610 family)